MKSREAELLEIYEKHMKRLQKALEKSIKSEIGLDITFSTQNTRGENNG